MCIYMYNKVLGTHMWVVYYVTCYLLTILYNVSQQSIKFVYSVVNTLIEH